ncbi:solute carrier family 23 protein [Pseudoroseomonas cervicalis]|uniref:solute carrier family 23 protein n=1 Tax=Teichococcus cervicalis TaxID=204525 RepID=UPI002783BAD9|nr:solute carrier family 23 protein [Pseudoroseomonas cervicalis]MDQ1079359.1 xanthine permease XanP [Pseudoroseomonas cervicalis]
MRNALSGWQELFDRRRDKKLERPPDVVHALEDLPPAADTAALALQQLAIQSIYFLLPGLVALAYGADAREATRFLCLSILALGLAGLLQAARRGPLGSGYALPFIPSPVFVAVYLLAAQQASLAQASALVAVAGLAGMLLVLALPRLSRLVPTEVAGVVVFLIGVSLLPRALSAAFAGGAAEAGAAGPALPGLAGAVALGALALMMLVALSRTRLARFGALLGALAGLVVSLALGLVPQGAAATLAALPWFALPAPGLPDARDFDWALMPAFLAAACASIASWLGDLVAFQRAADGDWKRPDEPPLRRGVLAGFGAITLAGLFGGMAPGTSSACVGLAIASRSLARIVAVAGAVALLLLSCSPKLVGLFVLVPDPVKAALLLYVCCFMMAAGCQLVTARMLDARRTFVAGLGLCAGLGVVIAPEFAAHLPRALQSPVTAGALVGFALNLLTLPFVVRQARFELALDARLAQQVEDRAAALGGAWGARRSTMDRMAHALLELAELLAARGETRLAVEAVFREDRVGLLLRHGGRALPPPSLRPEAADLDGPPEAQEAFALWLATRQASAFQQRSLPAGPGPRQELRLEFQD